MCKVAARADPSTVTKRFHGIWSFLIQESVGCEVTSRLEGVGIRVCVCIVQDGPKRYEYLRARQWKNNYTTRFQE